jgi:Cd2+/Zn2+-exporting ATPase
VDTGSHWAELGIFLVGYGVIGGDIVLKAARNIFRGQIFDENFLMTVATIGAFIIGECTGTIVLVATDDIFKGYIVIADEIKDDSPKAIRLLKEAKIRKTVMLTGDAKTVGEKVAKDLGLDLAYTELLPGDKVEKLEELLSGKSAKSTVAFVGDGINDAPVLALADVGIAMEGLGSDAAIEAADVVIMTDEPSKIATGIKISKKTLGIIKQNIFFSLAVKFSVLILAVFGLASMWAGVLADVGVTVLAVLNAARALRVDKL